MQVRSVECVDLNGIHNTQCDPTARPDSIQSCDVGIPCTNEVLTTEIDMRSPSSEKPMGISDGGDDDDDDEDDVTREVEIQEDEVGGDDGGENLSKIEVKKSSNTEDSEDEDDLEMQGDDPIDRNRNIPLNYQYRITRADRLFDPNSNPVPNEPT